MYSDIRHVLWLKTTWKKSKPQKDWLGLKNVTSVSGQKYLRKDLATWAGTDFCITESVIAHARQPLVGILELDLRLLKY